MIAHTVKFIQEKRWQLFFLLALCVLVYWKGLHYYFVDDDWGWLKFSSITDNCFKYFNPFYKPLLARTKFFRPVPLMFVCGIYHAYKMNPFPYHLFMLVFHLFNVALLYNFVHMISKHKTYAFVASLIFAFHFENFMGVLWLGNVHSMLNVFFIFLALTAWYRFLGSGNKLFYGGALASFTLAIFSKELSIYFLSVIMFSVDLIFARKIRPGTFRELLSWRFWRKYAPFGLAIVFYLVNYAIYRYPFTYSYGYGFHFNGIDQVAIILRMLQLMLIGTYSPTLLKAFIGAAFAVFLVFALFMDRDLNRTKDRLIWLGGIWLIAPTLLISVYSKERLHYCYLMSIGLGLVASGLVSQVFLKKKGLLRVLAAVLLGVLVLYWAIDMNHSAAQRISGEWYRSLIAQVHSYLPDVSEDEKMMFVPEKRGARFTYARLTGVVYPLEVSYGKELDIEICFREELDKDPGRMEGFTVFKVDSDIKREYIKIEPYRRIKDKG